MTNTRGIDYKNIVFDHPEVTKNHGQPTTQDVLTLQKEARANAGSVHTTLGGEQYGHLGLTCHDKEYAEIEDTQPYERPENPGELQVAEGATQYQIAQQKAEHGERLRRIYVLDQEEICQA